MAPDIDPIDVLADIARAGLTELSEQKAREISGDVLAEAASTAVSAAADHLLGPLVRIVLRVAEVQRRDLTALLSEPAVTGIRETNTALTIAVTSHRDAAIVEQRLHVADAKLAEAITLSKATGDVQRAAFLHLMRGLIAYRLAAYGVALHEYSESEQLLAPLARRHDEEVERDRAEWSRRTFLTGELAVMGYGATLRAKGRLIESLSPAAALLKRIGPLRDEASVSLSQISERQQQPGES